MTNEEVEKYVTEEKSIQILKLFREEWDKNSKTPNAKALDIAINSIQENTKLKAEIEQLKSTISKMETTTAQEDDLK